MIFQLLDQNTHLNKGALKKTKKAGQEENAFQPVRANSAVALNAQEGWNEIVEHMFLLGHHPAFITVQSTFKTACLSPVRAKHGQDRSQISCAVPF